MFPLSFLETPATAAERIHFQTNDVHLKDPAEITITWDKYNLTTNLAASLTISLWGYKESTIRPQLMYIDVLEVCWNLLILYFVKTLTTFKFFRPAFRITEDIPLLLRLTDSERTGPNF